MTDYTATNFYNDELSRLQSKQENANLILDSQERLAMLNDSYRKRYAKYVEILIVLVSAVAVYVVALFLQKTFPVIPQVAIDFIILVLLFLVFIYLFRAFWELHTRSLLNYDELDLSAYDSSGVDISELAAKGQIFDFQNSGNTCVGEECCPGYYDSDNNVCYSSVQSSTNTNTDTDTDTDTPTSTSMSSVTPTSTSGGSSISTAQNFTTLEYEQIETAYQNTTFDSPLLKREPNTSNVKPLQHMTVLTYSQF